MKSILRRAITLVSIGVIAMSLLSPSYAGAQGRGHGRGLAKKRLKFVNGHDARDGRLDGRGPRRRVSVWTYRGRGRHRGWVMRRHKRTHVRFVR